MNFIANKELLDRSNLILLHLTCLYKENCDKNVYSYFFILIYKKKKIE